MRGVCLYNNSLKKQVKKKKKEKISRRKKLESSINLCTTFGLHAVLSMGA